MFSSKGVVTFFFLITHSISFQVSANPFAQRSVRTTDIISIKSSLESSVAIHKPSKTVIINKSTGRYIYIPKPSSAEHIFLKSIRGANYIVHMSETNDESVRTNVYLDPKSTFFKECISTKFDRFKTDIDEILKSSKIKTSIAENCEDNLEPDKIAELEDSIHTVTKSGQSPIIRCLLDPIKSKKLSEYAGPVAATILVDETRNQHGLNSKNIEITCAPANLTRPSHARFVSPNKITIFTNDKSPVLSKCAPKLENILAHELMHSYGITNEVTVYQIERACGLVDEGNIECRPREVIEGQQSQGAPTVVALSGIASEQTKLDEQLTAKLVAQPELNLAKVEASSADWAQVANSDPGAPPPQALRNIASAANSNFTKMAQALDTALGVTGNKALAATDAPTPQAGGVNTLRAGSGVVPANTGNTRTRLASGGGAGTNTSKSGRAKNKNDNYQTVEEYLVDQNKIQTASGINTQRGALAAQNSPAANAGGVASATGSTGSNNPASPSNRELAANSLAQNNSLSNSAVSGNIQIRQSAKGSASGSARAPASSADVLTQLTTKPEITGADYQTIRSRYNDPEFKRSLSTNGISIKTPVATFGAKSKSAEIILEDDGTSLRRIEK
ncbi:MAG: hypothetical protein ACLGGX_10965 [Bdellovibrionia bacterium]